jgi:hypothetical protein
MKHGSRAIWDNNTMVHCVPERSLEHKYNATAQNGGGFCSHKRGGGGFG